MGREQHQAILLPLLAYLLFDFQKEFTISLRSKSLWGFPAGTSGKEPACQCRRLKRCRFDLWVRKIPWRRPANAGEVRDMGSIPGLGRSPGGRHDNPLQYSWLENPMDRGAWWALVHRVAKSWIQVKWVSTRTHTHIIMIKFEYLNLGSEYWENTEFVIIIIILTA